MVKLLHYIDLTRLNRPIGIWLLFLPCLFGITLALKKINLGFLESAKIVFLFAFGSIIMRSAGCVINDLFDQKFDAQVNRTKSRPLASGAVSRSEAFTLLGFLLLIGLIILLQFNKITIFAGFFGLILVITYPLMKRITYYPQLFLGITFNFGILMSALAILGEINFNFIILYFSAIIWTLIYDTIYAHQDIEDDLKIGVKSSAIKFGENSKNILLFLSLMMFGLIFYLGFKNSFKFSFFLINLIAFLTLTNKITLCNFKNSQNCLTLFRANFWIGILILIGILLG